MFDRRLFSEARAQRLLLWTGLLLNLMSAVMVVLQAWFLAQVISAVFLGQQDAQAVWPLMRRLGLAILLRALAAGAGETVARLTGARIIEDLRKRMFAQLIALGPAAIQRERSGELAATLVEGADSLKAYFGEYLPAIGQAAVLPLAIVIAVLPLDPLSGFVLLVTAPLIPYFMLLIGRMAERRTQRQWKTLGRLGAHFLDVMQGLRTLKLFGRSRPQADSIRSVSRAYAAATLDVLRVAFLSALALELLATISTAIVAVEIGLRLLYSRILFEQALFILILAPEFYLPLRNLGARFHAGMSGINAAARIFEIMDQVPAQKGEAAPSGELQLISFANVSYQYPSSQEPVVEHATFELQPGTLTALVGPSGAGKSTLMHMLLGFIPPLDGSIRVNGTDLASLDPEAWRAMLAWVPQQPYLFNDSIAANLRLASPQARDAQLWAALEQAQLAETVRSLPDELETPINERGARLSGGQAQRLALARAYLKDAPLLLLDEPTAHLDAQTGAAVSAALSAWRARRMVLVIAHLPETMQQADQILLVRAQRVHLVGSYQDLLAHADFHGFAMQAGAQ